MDQWMQDLLTRIGKLEDRIRENERTSAYHDTLIDRIKTVIREEVLTSTESVRSDIKDLRERMDLVEDEAQEKTVNADWRRRIGSWVLATVAAFMGALLTNITDIIKWFKN